MTETGGPRWLQWAREIQALSQTGLAYCQNEYEKIRIQRLLEIAAEIVESHTKLRNDELMESFEIQHGYATPKVDVRAAVVQKGKVLLVQERIDDRWCMPGGWADVGELPSKMVAREALEESGFEVQPRKVIGVYDANRGGTPVDFFHAYKVVFLCTINGGEARISHETQAVDFFGFDELPPLSPNRTNERHLADVQAHVQDPSLPTVFD